MGDGGLCKLFVDDCESWQAPADADDLFGILQTWEECIKGGGGGRDGVVPGAAAAAFSRPSSVPAGGACAETSALCARPTLGARHREADGERFKGGPVRKKHKGSTSAAAPVAAAKNDDVDDGAAKISHITVERNRRKQMNENLAVLRTLMPCFYVKRGDQASVIGGVVDYIQELQQVLHSLETKKHRKVYADQVLSPRPATSTAPSPRPPPLSPRPFMVKSAPPPLSPRLAVPISPGTPTPGSPYKPCLPHLSAYISPAMTPTASSSSSHTYDIVPRTYLPTLDSIVTELAAARPSRFLLPDVKVEFAGPNLVLKTMSHRAPGQVLKIIAALESLSLEILHVSISAVHDTMVHSFTIKIGIECELSAEELVHEIRQTFL